MRLRIVRLGVTRLRAARPSLGAALLLSGALLFACSKSEPSDPEPLPHNHDGHTHGSTGGSDALGGMGGLGGVAGETGSEMGGSANEGVDPTPYAWDLPPSFPTPSEPEGNPTTREKVELGRHLFYDKRLSGNDSMSCASCHQQELAFTDGKTTPLGSTAEVLPRNSMTLANVGYASTLTWGHPLMLELERQALIPMFGETPVELGLRDADEVESKLQGDSKYQALFAAAYPEADQLGTLAQVTQALSAFQRTLISGNAPYDRWLSGEENAISTSAQRGYALFNSEKLECFHCHVGFNLSDHTHWANKPFFDSPFHNTGLYNIDGKGAYPEPNTGVHSITSDPSDMGRFKAPTLRNIAVTAPYMHDGSIASLSEVLDHYAAGGRTISEGPSAGEGSKSPLKSNLIVGFELSEKERADVIAFLESLTDEEFLTNPAYGDPWAE
jgi:cytochrome c peroxidase